MKRKGQVPKLSTREREFETLLRRASEITTVQRSPLDSLKERPVLVRAPRVS